MSADFVISNESDVARAGRFWEAGKDTMDIAQALGCHEAHALQLVGWYRRHKREGRRFA